MWPWNVKNEDIDTLESFEFDINSIGIVDESQIRVSDSDLNDPQLLSELNSLKNDEEDVSSFDDLPPNMETNHQKDTAQIDILSLKQKAVALKKEGKKDAALQVLKEAKLLERDDQQFIEKRPPQKYSIPSSVKTESGTSNDLNIRFSSRAIPDHELSSISKEMNDVRKLKVPPDNFMKDDTPSPVFVIESDVFAPLENAINEAMKSLLQEAKTFKDSDPHKAAEKFRKYKTFKDELLVLASRKVIPGAIPPLFRWDIISKETVIEDHTLGDDQLKLVIRNLKDFDAVLQEYSSRTLSLSYNVGVIKDSPEYHTKQVKYKNSEKIAEFNEENIFAFRRKGSTLESQFSRKKVSFTLILHRGMFQSDKILGVAKLNLSELLTKCKTGGYIQLLDPGGKKAIGGQLEVYAMLRRPISKPEIRIDTERELIIQEWPSAVFPEKTALHQSVLENEPVIVDQTVPLTSPMNQISTIDFSQLSDLEKSDPLNVNLIVSNDVLESEISSTESLIACCRDPDIIGDLQIRLMLLQGKLAVLVNQVQTEALSLEDYLNLLKKRLESDKRLAVYCNQTHRREDALQVMKRVRIMQKEIASVEEAGDESGSL